MTVLTLLVKARNGGQLSRIDELLKVGESRTIEPRTPHRFSSTYGGSLLEVSTHHDDADVVRLEPSGCSA